MPSLLLLILFLTLWQPALATKQVSTKIDKEISKEQKEAEKIARELADKRAKLERIKAKAFKRRQRAQAQLEKARLEAKHLESIDLDDEPNAKVEVTDIDTERIRLKEQEAKAISFINPSITVNGAEIAAEDKEFYNQAEQDQLLELWRATLARNRTVQFVVQSLSTDPNDIEQNNSVLQMLTRTMFVPFYTLQALTSSTLIGAGSAVGARVIGDVVDHNDQQRNIGKHITRTDLIVLFMLVDEVAERLRSTFYNYKDAVIETGFLENELIAVRSDAEEAFARKSKTGIFMTRLMVRDLERKLRNIELDKQSARRKLLELAGLPAVDSVDKLISLELKRRLL